MIRPFLPCLLLLTVAPLGCDADATADGGADTDVFGDHMPDDLPAGNCGGVVGAQNCDTDGDSAGVADGSTGVGEANCLVDGCMGQGVCAASWDAEAEVRGDFECRFACIPLLDDGSWCSDDASCCDANAHCTNRGYCVLGDDESGSSTGDTDASTGGESGDTDASTGDATSTGGSESTGTGGGQ